MNKFHPNKCFVTSKLYQSVLASTAAMQLLCAKASVWRGTLHHAKQ